MKLEQFEFIIKHMYEAYEKSTNLYNNGVDISSFEDHYNHVIEKLFTEIYSGEGYEWIIWYCYDNSFGKGGLDAFDSEKNRICYDIKSLHEYLEKTYIEQKDKKREDVLSNDDDYSDYLSLYDFLGKAAGSTLGLKTYDVATSMSVPTRERIVNTKNYNGPVRLYPRYFLEFYFNSIPKQKA